MGREKFINTANCGCNLNPVYFLHGTLAGYRQRRIEGRGGASRCFLSVDGRQKIWALGKGAGANFCYKERKQWKKEKALDPILDS